LRETITLAEDYQALSIVFFLYKDGKPGTMQLALFDRDA
jgi:hypothetical protein